MVLNHFEQAPRRPCPRCNCAGITHTHTHTHTLWLTPLFVIDSLIRPCRCCMYCMCSQTHMTRYPLVCKNGRGDCGTREVVTRCLDLPSCERCKRRGGGKVLRMLRSVLACACACSYHLQQVLAHTTCTHHLLRLRALLTTCT